MTIPNWDNSALKNGLFLLTDEELEEVLKQQKEKSDEAYQRFTRCAPSRGATYVKQFSEANTLSQKISELKTIRKVADQHIRHYEYEEFKVAVKEKFGDAAYREIIDIVDERIKAYKISGLMRHEYTRAASKANATSINKL